MRSTRRYLKSLLHRPLFAVLRALAIHPLLTSRHRTFRHFLFEALQSTGYTGPLLSRDGAEIFVHDSRDRGPGRELFIRGTQDAGKMETAIRLLREAGHPPIVRFADIGANIGTICIPAIRRGFAATAIALEAVPDIVRLLKANILLNGLEDKIAVVHAAAGARAGEFLQIAVNASNMGDNRIGSPGPSADGKDVFSATASVVTTTLDDLLGDGLETTLIWMDIQGYEGIALLGATRTLARRPPMVLEFCPQLMNAAASYAALKSSVAGYRGFHDLGRPGKIQAIDALDALAAALGDGGGFTDILLMP